jgi:formate-dependent nitrite reductase membrane component NrfD
MQEELFISGRDIPNIDPYLQIWHWPISVYLFLGGLAAGIIFFSSVITVLGKDKEYVGAVKYATLVPPVALSLGLLALVYDLTHPLYTYQLYTTIRLESPMSWGAWVLLITTPLTFLWVLTYYSEFVKNSSKRIGFLVKIEEFLVPYRKQMAYALIPLSIILGVYTGILLSAFNARPLWNNAILGPLFLTSGLSTGAATIILLARSSAERHLFTRIDLALIVLELGLIVHMIMGMHAGSQVQLEAMQLLVGGEFTLMFFGFVIILGLLVPATIELMEILGKKIPAAVPAMLILLGGLIFRFVMVEAGQITRYLY